MSDDKPYKEPPKFYWYKSNRFFGGSRAVSPEGKRLDLITLVGFLAGALGVLIAFATNWFYLGAPIFVVGWIVVIGATIKRWTRTDWS